MSELELKIEKLIKDQMLITESEAQDLATLICNLPEINGGRVGAVVMPNEVVAGGKILQHLRTQLNIADGDYMNAMPNKKDYWDGYVQAIRDIISFIER